MAAQTKSNAARKECEGVRILFVTARFPDPPLKGDQVRSYHQIRQLAPRHDITLLSFEEGATPEGRARVENLCERVVIMPFKRASMRLSLLGGLLSPLPFQTLHYQSLAMHRATRELLANGGFDVAHIQLARMTPYLEGVDIPCVVDLIDALSLNMERRAKEEVGRLATLKARLLRTEKRRMLRYERHICRTFDQVTVVSAVDKAAIEGKKAYSNLHVNPNGVDLDDFAFQDIDDPRRESNTLIFSGNMSYFPNINAMTWFCREVLPLIKAQIPSTKLLIVGNRPTPEVQALASDPAVTVTGFVENMSDYQTRSTVAVAPMRGGSGIQNKVIEAMACGTPVVATPFALGGIAASHDVDLLVGSDAATFAAETVRLLTEAPLRQRLSLAGRRLVEEKYSWTSAIDKLERLYECAVANYK